MNTISLTLADVYEGLTGLRPAGLSQHITTTVVDSRDAKPGALFVALEGEQLDGHDYVADAFSRGAVAAIIERDVDAEALTLDLTDPELALPEAWSLPLLLKVERTLTALQRAAAFWRRSLPELRVIGITGSVGKTTTKEMVA
ncbi:MAG: Mur ligase domain-containing protein, partial [Anaerolineae bacterium]